MEADPTLKLVTVKGNVTSLPTTPLMCGNVIAISFETLPFM